jgi:hypothetical protein
VVLKADRTEDSGWQLLGVANQNQPLAAVKQRDETRNLDSLARLVNHHSVELDFSILEHSTSRGRKGCEDKLAFLQNLLLGKSDVGLVDLLLLDS